MIDSSDDVGKSGRFCSHLAEIKLAPWPGGVKQRYTVAVAGTYQRTG